MVRDNGGWMSFFIIVVNINIMSFVIYKVTIERINFYSYYKHNGKQYLSSLYVCLALYGCICVFEFLYYLSVENRLLTFIERPIIMFQDSKS